METGLRPAWGAGRIGWHIRDADSVVLTARQGAAWRASRSCVTAMSVAHLNLLAVDPGHRRRGMARTLVQWLEDTALTAGTFTIRLELREHNAAARAFYRTLGYRENGQMPGYYQGVETAMRLQRDVRAARRPGERQATRQRALKSFRRAALRRS